MPKIPTLLLCSPDSALYHALLGWRNDLVHLEFQYHSASAMHDIAMVVYDHMSELVLVAYEHREVALQAYVALVEEAMKEQGGVSPMAGLSIAKSSGKQKRESEVVNALPLSKAVVKAKLVKPRSSCKGKEKADVQDEVGETEAFRSNVEMSCVSSSMWFLFLLFPVYAKLFVLLGKCGWFLSSGIARIDSTVVVFI